MSVEIDVQRFEASKEAFILIPGGSVHTLMWRRPGIEPAAPPPMRYPSMMRMRATMRAP